MQKNLFRYNENSNRTKHSIEEVGISELGYALMQSATKVQGKKRKRDSDESEDEGAVASQTEEGLASNQAALTTLFEEVQGETTGTLLSIVR